MGLMDVLNGMMNGPRGQRQPAPPGQGGGGMSPMMMALLALLAYKALKGRHGSTAAPPPQPGGTVTAGPAGGLGDILGGLLRGGAGGTPGGAKPSGSLNDILKGGLGGLLGGAAAGTLVSGGLGNLIKELQEKGYGNAAQSWVSSGPNQEIAPKDLEHALGSDAIDTVARQTGMSRDDLLNGLSDFLPDLVDQLTPHGRLPTAHEAATMG
jgi:uncharacterized protein YidB (DUF937 family)